MDVRTLTLEDVSRALGHRPTGPAKSLAEIRRERQADELLYQISRTEDRSDVRDLILEALAAAEARGRQEAES
jgi:hypothetical protein